VAQEKGTQRKPHRLPALVASKHSQTASGHVLGARQIGSLKDMDNEMDNWKPSQSARHGNPVLAWKPHSGSISTNRNASAITRRIVASSDLPHSQFISSDPPVNIDQAYNERLQQHQSAEVPLDAFGTLSLRRSLFPNGMI
jgi:hypothetical protein